MMLADHILAARGSVYDFGGAITSLGNRIEQAQRFEMTDAVAIACLELFRSKPSSLLKALPLCRLPYDTIWMEMRGGLAGENSRGPSAPTPVQQGTLIEALGDRQGVMTVAWTHKEDDRLHTELEKAPNSSTYAIYFDWRPDGNVRDLVRRMHRKFIAEAKSKIVEMAVEAMEQKYLGSLSSNEETREFIARGNMWPQYANDPREVEALRIHDQHMAPGLSPHGLGMIKAVIAAGLQHDKIDGLGAILKNWARDVEGEGPFAEFFLAMLNSRNCIEREAVPMAKLNKARAKRGKSALLDYTKIKLVMTRARQRAAIAAGMDRETMKQHLVMGHFKIRKSGVYWWNSFVRGDGSKPMNRKRYEVA